MNVLIIPSSATTNEYQWYSTLASAIRIRLNIRTNILRPPKEHNLTDITNLIHRYANNSTIIIGHFDGALAGMRYTENNKSVALFVLGANYDNDGNNTNQSYMWDFDGMMSNCKYIYLYMSSNDGCISMDRYEKLRSELVEAQSDYCNLRVQTGKFGHFNDNSMICNMLLNDVTDLYNETRFQKYPIMYRRLLEDLVRKLNTGLESIIDIGENMFEINMRMSIRYVDIMRITNPDWGISILSESNPILIEITSKTDSNIMIDNLVDIMDKKLNQCNDTETVVIDKSMNPYKGLIKAIDTKDIACVSYWLCRVNLTMDQWLDNVVDILYLKDASIVTTYMNCINAYPDCDYPNVMNEAIATRDPNIVRIVLQHQKDPNESLLTAFSSSNADIMMMYLDHPKVNVSQDASTLLHYAVGIEDDHVTMKLLRHPTWNKEDTLEYCGNFGTTRTPLVLDYIFSLDLTHNHLLNMLQSAIINHNTVIIKRVLEDRDLVVLSVHDWIVSYVVTDNNLEIVKLFLVDGRFNFEINGGQLMDIAFINNREMYGILMDHYHCDA